MKNPSLGFERWPRFATHHPWRVIAGALAIVAVLIGLVASTGGGFVDSFSIPGTESQKAMDLLQERFPQQAGGTATVVVKAPGDLRSPEIRPQIEALLDDLNRLPEVVGVSSPFEQPGSISADGTIARISTQYAVQATDLETSSIDALVDLRKSFDGSSLQVELGGGVASVAEQEEPGSSELLGIVAAVFILLIAFGSVVAMGLPIITALMGLIPGFIIVSLLSAFVDMPSFTTQFGAMIGIGVGIDYALLIVNRFREALGRQLSVDDAVVQAASTAGRSVLFAGSVVVIALLGLWAVGIPFVSYLGTAAAILVACTVVVAVFVLPAILKLVGRKIDRLTIPGLSTKNGITEKSVAMRWSRKIQRYPLVFLISGLAIAAVLATPVLDLRLGSADAGSGPESSTTRRAYDLQSEGFGPGFNGQILVAIGIDDPSALETVNTLPGLIGQVEGVAAVSPLTFNQDSSAAIISVIPKTSPQDEATDALVNGLRHLLPAAVAGQDAEVLVGGSTAVFIDVADKISAVMPLFFAMVIGLSFVLLAAVFRSILVPLKAALMILVSVGAAFGVLVAVFQWGWMGGLLGVDSTGPVESFLPMMMFAILFGLSMDYEVFLVTRMHEEYQRTGDNGEAVARGQAITMRVILAAGAIMTSVFLSFIIVDARVIKEFGIGLATAIFIDAALVRMVLVPSIMHLLGSRNWWFPAWLDKILPRLHVEAEPEDLPAPEGYGAPIPGASPLAPNLRPGSADD